jgi:hypothetical protein
MSPSACMLFLGVSMASFDLQVGTCDQHARYTVVWSTLYGASGVGSWTHSCQWRLLPFSILTGAQNKIKNFADKAKAYVNNVSELELKVLEATNHDPWGPHGSVMQGGPCLSAHAVCWRLAVVCQLQGRVTCMHMQRTEAPGWGAAVQGTHSTWAFGSP